MVDQVLILQNRWKLKKTTTINPENDHDDDGCFQYGATNALYYEKIKWHPERVSNIKLFIYSCNCEIINCLSKIED